MNNRRRWRPHLVSALRTAYAAVVIAIAALVTFIAVVALLETIAAGQVARALCPTCR